MSVLSIDSRRISGSFGRLLLGLRQRLRGSGIVLNRYVSWPGRGIFMGMKIRNFYTYLCYRMYRWFNGPLGEGELTYRGWSRWDLPVAMLIVFNAGVIVNLILRVLMIAHVIDPGWQGVGEYLSAVNILLFFV